VILYGHDAVIARWAGNRLGIADWGPCTTIGIMRHGDLVAAAVFHQYRHPNIEASIVTTDRRWATPNAIRAIMRYPFVQLGCKRLTAITEARNHPAREFLCRLGFRQEGYHEDVFETGDACSYGLLRRDAAKWLTEERPKSGQEFTVTTSCA
jgi:hypothetical protein